jgi:hypothetical protein
VSYRSEQYRVPSAPDIRGDVTILQHNPQKRSNSGSILFPVVLCVDRAGFAQWYLAHKKYRPPPPWDHQRALGVVLE